MQFPRFVHDFAAAHKAIRMSFTLTPAQRARRLARLHAAQARNWLAANEPAQGLLELRVARVHQLRARTFAPGATARSGGRG